MRRVNINNVYSGASKVIQAPIDKYSTTQIVSVERQSAPLLHQNPGRLEKPGK